MLNCALRVVDFGFSALTLSFWIIIVASSDSVFAADITELMLANNGQNAIELTENSTVVLDSQTLPLIIDSNINVGNPLPTLVYRGQITGFGTLTVTASHDNATLVLTANSSFSTPPSLQTEWYQRGSTVEMIYDGVDYGRDESWVAVMHGAPNPPGLIIQAGATVQLGDLEGTGNENAGTVHSVDQSGIFPENPILGTPDSNEANLTNIEVSGTLDVEGSDCCYNQHLGMISGSGNFYNKNGAFFDTGESEFYGHSNLYSSNIGNRHVFGALANSTSLFNSFVLAYVKPPETTPNGSDSAFIPASLVVPGNIFFQHYGGSIHNQGTGLIIFSGTYSYSDSGDPQNPSCSDDRLNNMTITRNTIPGNGTNSSYHRLFLSGVNQFGSGDTAKPFVEGNRTNSNIWMQGSGTISFDYNAPTSFNVPIGGSHGSSGVDAEGSGGCNLIVLSNASNQNYVTFTQPMGCNGFTKIDVGTVLQLGDGTVGNSNELQVVTPGGYVIEGVYSTSGGNGSILTAETNYTFDWGDGLGPIQFLGDANDSIELDGTLITDNVIGGVNGISQQSLSNISGSGDLVQRGSLPLTLYPPIAYTGTTTVENQSMLVLGNLRGVDASISSSASVDIVGDGSIFDISTTAAQLVKNLSGGHGATLFLGSNVLTVESNVGTAFNGIIKDGGIYGGVGGGLVKAGPSRLDLGGENLFTGPTDVLEGTLALSGSLRNSNVENDAILIGVGTVRNLRNNGVLSPGGIAHPHAQLVSATDIVLTANSLLSISANEAPGLSPLSAYENVYLDGGVRITLAERPASDLYVLVHSENGKISGTFASVQTPNSNGKIIYSDHFVYYSVASSDVIFHDGFD